MIGVGARPWIGAAEHEKPRLLLVDDDEDIARGCDLGANGYVRKPVDLNRFTEAARQLGEYWLGLNEPPPICWSG